MWDLAGLCGYTRGRKKCLAPFWNANTALGSGREWIIFIEAAYRRLESYLNLHGGISKWLSKQKRPTLLLLWRSGSAKACPLHYTCPQFLPGSVSFETTNAMQTRH